MTSSHDIISPNETRHGLTAKNSGTDFPVDTETATGKNNGPAIIAMIAAMAAYAGNDALIKIASETLPSGQTIFLRSVVSAVLAIGLALIFGKLRFPRALASGPVFWRVVGELGASICFVLALFSLPIASVTAILQVVPLALTAVSAVFLREAVGWRRWLAAALGLVGVALIVRPGGQMFQPASLLAFGAVLCVVLRDTVTRKIPPIVTGEMLTVVNVIVILPYGLAFLPFETWRTPTQFEWLCTSLSGILVVAGIYLLVLSVRWGEVSATANFRYAVVLFATIFGWLIWDELPDTLATIGIAIIIGAGLYTLRRQESVEAKPKNSIT